MSWRVIVRPEAETDLRETQVWYDSRRPGLGDEFLTEVERAVLLLAEKPDCRPVYYNGFRLFITADSRTNCFTVWKKIVSSSFVCCT